MRDLLRDHPVPAHAGAAGSGGGSGRHARRRARRCRSGSRPRWAHRHSGAIRIVAQIRTDDATLPGPVRFCVDGQLLATDTDGPPYVVEWVDENPFERREITVEVTDALGREVTDSVVLEPFDLIDETQVTSVLVEASVQDKQGRVVKSVRSRSSPSWKTACRRRSTWRNRKRSASPSRC